MVTRSVVTAMERFNGRGATVTTLPPFSMLNPEQELYNLGACAGHPVFVFTGGASK